MLPYSSKVEYVRSTGAQWFDTGCSPVAPRIEVDMAVEEWPTGTGDSESGPRPHMALCGVDRFSFGDVGDHGNLKFISGESGVLSHFDSGHSLESLVGRRHTYIFDLIDRKSGVDTASYSGSSGTMHDGKTVFLLASNMPRARRGNVRDGNSVYLNRWIWGAAARMKARLYGAKLWDGMTLLRNFIPVRIGKGSSSEGALYDFVSGTVFRSAGDPFGDGCIGPDVKNDIRATTYTPYEKTGEMPVRIVGGFGDRMPDALTLDEIRDSGLPGAPLYTYLDYVGLNYSDEEVLDTFGSVPQVDVGAMYSPEKGVVVLEIEAVSHLSDMPEVKLRISHTAGKTVTVDWNDIYYMGDDSGTDGTLEFFHRYYAPGTGKGTYLVKIHFEDGDGLSFGNGFLSVPSADVANGRRFSANLLMAVFGKGARADVSGISSLKTVFLSDSRDVVSGAFSGCTSLESVCLPTNLDAVPDSLFQGTSLKSVVIPKSVESIGANAFKGVTTLKRVSLPYGLTSIGASSFEGCASLDRLPVPKTLTSVGEASFKGCSSLEHMTFPEGVTSIPASCFEECSALSLVETAGELSSFGARAFKNCKFLSGIGGRMTTLHEVPEECFMGCSSLKDEFTSFGSLHAVGAGAFNGCSTLTGLTVQGGTGLGIGALNGCTLLMLRIALSSSDPGSFRGVDFGYGYAGTSAVVVDGEESDSISIPDGVEPFDNGYRNCLGLHDVELPQSLFGRAASIFSGCHNLKTIRVRIDDVDAWFETYRLPDNKWEIRLIGQDGEEITRMEASAGVSSLGTHAFMNCVGLETVRITDSVQSLDGTEFQGCSSLTTSEVVVRDMPSWCANEVNANLAGDRRLYDGNGDEITSIVVPSGSSVGYRSFYMCSGITSVVAEEGSTIEGQEAFSLCRSLESVTLNGDVSEEAVNSFTSCGNLSSVSIGGQVEALPDGMFMACSSLMSVGISGNVASIGDHAFSGCYSLESVSMSSSVKSIGESAFSGCVAVSRVYSPSVASWLSIKFDGRSSNPAAESADGDLYIDGSVLEDLVVPNGTQRIDSYAFAGCRRIRSVTFGTGLEGVGSMAFDGCTGIVSVVAPSLDTWLSISFADETANPCWQSHSLSFGSSPVRSVFTSRHVKNYAFAGCTGITEVSLNGQSVGVGAFKGCRGLSSVVATVAQPLGEESFFDCGEIGSVRVSGMAASEVIGQAMLCVESGTTVSSLSIAGGKCLLTGDTAVGLHGPLYTSDAIVSMNGVVHNDGTPYRKIHGIDGVTSINASGGSLSIDTEAFSGSSTLSSISVQSCSLYVGEFAFSGKLSAPESYSIPYWGTEMPRQKRPWATELNEKPNRTLKSVSVSGSGASVTLARGALSECASLSSFAIDDSVTGVVVIGDGGLADCVSLSSLSLGRNASSVRIGDFAFLGCRSLRSVSVGDAPSYVGSAVFADCSGLMSFTAGENLKECGSSLFADDCSSLTDIYFNAIDSSVNPGAFAPVTRSNNVNAIHIGNKVKKICGFYGPFPNVKSITLPSSLEEIQPSAFHSFQTLTSLSFPPSLRKIGRDAFHACNDLLTFDFTRHKFVPDLTDWRAFGVARIQGRRIIVPTKLYNAWRTSQNWDWPTVLECITHP